MIKSKYLLCCGYIEREGEREEGREGGRGGQRRSVRRRVRGKGKGTGRRGREKGKGERSISKKSVRRARERERDRKGGKEREGVSEREREREGVIGNHAYSILEIEKVDGVVYLQIFNPQGKAVWEKSKLHKVRVSLCMCLCVCVRACMCVSGDVYVFVCHGHTHTLSLALFRQPTNKLKATTKGSFWLSFSQFCQSYNRIHCCMLVNDSERLSLQRFDGEWREMGGCSDFASFRANPMFLCVSPGVYICVCMCVCICV